jgi:hypothetical protein
MDIFKFEPVNYLSRYYVRWSVYTFIWASLYSILLYQLMLIPSEALGGQDSRNSNESCSLFFQLNYKLLMNKKITLPK